MDVPVLEEAFIVDKKVVDLKIPHSVMIILIYRNGKYFAPNGSTVIERHDVLTLMSENEKDVEYVRSMCQNASAPVRKAES